MPSTASGVFGGLVTRPRKTREAIAGVRGRRRRAERLAPGASVVPFPSMLSREGYRVALGLRSPLVDDASGELEGLVALDDLLPEAPAERKAGRLRTKWTFT